MTYLIVFGWVLAGFALMEIISYLVHRFLFHGVLWNIHESHHKPNHGLFELNDLFSLFFAAVSIWFIYIGSSDPFSAFYLGTGIGIAVYGLLYFIIHDLFTHKRFFPIKSENRVMRLVRRAHQRHHQDVGEKGQEPYGLFLFPYDEYKSRNKT